MKIFYITILLISFIPCKSHSQTQRVPGKVITDYGTTFSVENPDVETDTTAVLKVIFDISKSSEDKSEINKYIETAARFLNMHVDAGFKPEQLKVAMVIHGGAWQDVLKDSIYSEKFEMNNPNAPLIQALSKANVEVILCGQTAGARQMKDEDIDSNVKMALSAMTTLLQYEKTGYTIIKL